MDDAKRDEIKAKNPGVELTLIKIGDAEIVFRPPSRAEYRRYLDKLVEARKSGRPGAEASEGENLVRGCVVHPDGAAFDAMLDKRPALADRLGKDVLEAAGMLEATEKKVL